jgi:transposase-like protein
MTQSKKNRSWSSEEKLQIIKSHLVGGKSVSQICEEHELAPHTRQLKTVSA